MTNSAETTNDIVFSLDIGTRTVIGIVAKYENQTLKIIASEVLSHEKRAMYDGQIHDINSVVRVAQEVKENLENKTGHTLNEVAVAAAGRSLEISRSRVVVDVDSDREIDRNVIRSAEIEAVQNAERLLKEKENIKDKKYYCVGHTVINYYLDDILIENLEGHRGEQITVDLIATFLPHTVVDSLSTVMDRLNLEIVNMTLEPIAAINIAVKKNLRLLNIALVDIGAGTSDIAITKDGTVSSYAMVPLAGDEITEQLVKTYLLDYDIAEKLKIELNKSEEHEFQDIIGTTHKLNREEILDKVDSSIKKLAQEISEKILELNDSSPSVVFLIGGGSQIPRLSKYIADILEIPEERVDIKDTSLIEGVKGIDNKLTGPESITPVGIALMSIKNNHKDFIEVELNKERVRIFNMEKARITDALLLTGFNPRNLVSKRGKSLIYSINGQEKTLQGQLGEPAKVYLNGELTHIEHRIKENDEIKIENATTGKDAEIKIYDVVDKTKAIYLDNEKYNLMLNLYLNNREIEEDVYLTQDDNIETIEIETVNNLLNHLELDSKYIKTFKDEQELSTDYILKKGDILTTQREKNKKTDNSEAKSTIQTNSNNLKIGKIIELNINNEKKHINYNKENFQFVDVFDHIDFDLTQVKGNLVLKVNGDSAEYLQDLKNGDVLEIYWED